MTPWTKYEYSLDDYPFPTLVARSLGVDDLTTLSADLPRRTSQTDQQSPWHGWFYDGYSKWRSFYDTFVFDHITPLVGEPFCYQNVPTFRVHLPGNVAVGEMHTDARWHHPPGEIAFWLPLTEAHDTSSLWVEDDDGDLRCVDAVPGDVIKFNAVDRLHGNKINETGRARVSFDFRVLPARLLSAVDSQRRTEHTQMRFVPGEYYADRVVAS